MEEAYSVYEKKNSRKQTRGKASQSERRSGDYTQTVSPGTLGALFTPSINMYNLTTLSL